MLFLFYTCEVRRIPDGAGPMTQADAQMIRFLPQPVGGGGWPLGPGPVGVLVPGGNSPTIGNFNTALTGSSSTPAAGSMAADLSAQINAALSEILGFATGGG